jgi:hypothetical protein
MVNGYRNLRQVARSVAASAMACGIGGVIAAAAVTPSAAAQEIVLRQSFPFGGSTAVTDGTYGYGATGYIGAGSACAVHLVAPVAGYISRVEARFNPGATDAILGDFSSSLRLHSSANHAGASPGNGDLGGQSWSAFPNEVRSAGIAGGPAPAWETYWTPSNLALPLAQGQSAYLSVQFYADLPGISGGLSICETRRNVNTGDIQTGDAGLFRPLGWVYTTANLNTLFSGELAINVYFTPTTTCTAPTITTQPQPVSTCPTGTATFSVAADGTGPFTYQWQWRPTGGQFANVIDGVNTDPQGGPIQFTATGARTGTVSIENTGGTGTAGSHWEKRCIVTNACSSVTSDAATLTICAADFNCDDFIDFTDFDGFVTAFEAGDPTSDFNADGFLDFTDFDAFVTGFEAGC